MGYEGGYTIPKDYVSPRRQRHPVKAPPRFETRPGEQAQVDWGSLPHVSTEGRRRRKWAFVMVMGYSRAIYLELVNRTDAATFIACHVNAFEYFSGIPRRCLYDNAKVVVLGRDRSASPTGTRACWTSRCGSGLGSGSADHTELETKGKVERGDQVHRNNFWPSARFDDDEDLNRPGAGLVRGHRQPAHPRHHRQGAPARARAVAVPSPPAADRASLVPYLRQDRRVGRDGYVRFDGSATGCLAVGNEWCRWFPPTTPSRSGAAINAWPSFRAGRQRAAPHAARAVGGPADFRQPAAAASRSRSRSPPTRWSGDRWTSTSSWRREADGHDRPG